MITQIVEMETDCCDHVAIDVCTQHRIVGEIDGDQVFWAYAQEIVDGEWVDDDGIVSYQRDSIAVPNLEHDPDVLTYFAGQGLSRVGDVRPYGEWVATIKRLRWESRVDGKCEICGEDYPAHCTCPSDVDCDACQNGKPCLYH